MKMTLNEEIEYLQSGNWYDKVWAVLPTDEYLKLGWAIGDILEVLELFRSLAPEPQTNADRIRAMSDKELAVASVRYEGTVVNATRYGGHEHKFYGPHGEPCANKEQAILMWFNWLQQPAEEDT